MIVDQEGMLVTTEDSNYTFYIVDRQNSYVMYEGWAIYNKDTWAAPSLSSPVWKIKRTLVNGTITKEELAGGGIYKHVWNDRETYFSPGAYDNQYSTSFDGINDYVDFGNNFEYSGVTAFSVSLWIKPQNLAATRLFVGKVTNDANVYGWRIGHDSAGKTITQMRGPAQANGIDTWPTTLTAGVWTHIAWAYSGSGNKSGQSLYINGVKEAFTPAGASVTNMAATPYPLTLGRAPGNYFVGGLDEFSVWTKELTQADVTEIYNSGSPNDLSNTTISANLAGWWRMGDGSVYPTIYDEVGSVNGTMTNMSSSAFVLDVP